jgi:hypothetical protein
MEQEELLTPQISTELQSEISLECEVLIKGLKKSGINVYDEFTLEANGASFNEEMMNGIEEAVCMLEDENPNFKLATVKSINTCTAREKRTVCFVRA